MRVGGGGCGVGSDGAAREGRTLHGGRQVRKDVRQKGLVRRLGKTKTSAKADTGSEGVRGSSADRGGCGRAQGATLNASVKRKYGCRVAAGLLSVLAWAYTPYYKCQRYGEAKNPGPYFVGGASSSGQSLLQGGDVQRVDSKAGTAAERGTMCEEDHSGEMGLDGRICEEMLDAEHEWVAMQERRKQDGVMALLQGGLHEIDEEEPFRVGPLELEGTAHSCSIAMECLGNKEKGAGGRNVESREA